MRWDFFISILRVFYAHVSPFSVLMKHELCQSCQIHLRDVMQCHSISFFSEIQLPDMMECDYNTINHYLTVSVCVFYIITAKKRRRKYICNRHDYLEMIPQ